MVVMVRAKKKKNWHIIESSKVCWFVGGIVDVGKPHLHTVCVYQIVFLFSTIEIPHPTHISESWEG